MNLLKRLFLPLFIMLLELWYLIYCIMVNLLSQILRNLNSFLCEKFLNQFVRFSKRKFEYFLTVDRWKDVVSIGIFIEFFSINKCQLYKIIPSQVTLIENMLNVLLQILASHRCKPTNFVENAEPFMLISVFFYRIQKILQ